VLGKARFAGRLGGFDAFLKESRIHVDVVLLENSRPGIDEAVRSSRFHDQDVAGAGIADDVADYESRFAFQHQHDLVVFMKMQGRAAAGLRFDDEDRDGDVALISPDERNELPMNGKSSLRTACMIGKFCVPMQLWIRASAVPLQKKSAGAWCRERPSVAMNRSGVQASPFDKLRAGSTGRDAG